MSRSSLVLLGLLLLAALAAGCSSPPRRTQPPAPVITRGELSLPTDEQRPYDQRQEPAIAAYVPPAVPQTARPEPAKAVQVLMRRAEEQRRDGDLASAVSSIERGLRIEPRNSELWHRLAVLREAQGKYALAEDLAVKSNSMAGAYDEQLLKRDNWQLIARSRRAQGKESEARDAERQAGRY